MKEGFLTTASREMFGNLGIATRFVTGLTEKPWASVKESLLQFAGRKTQRLYRRPLRLA